MEGHFKGWRRRCGCVMLVISLGFLAVWMRSKFTYDTVQISLDDRQYQIQSFREECVLWSWGLKGNEGVFGFHTWHEPDLLFIATFVDEKRRQLNTNPLFLEWIIPYWLPTLATGLLSAYLLFSRDTLLASAGISRKS